MSLRRVDWAPSRSGASLLLSECSGSGHLMTEALRAAALAREGGHIARFTTPKRDPFRRGHRGRFFPDKRRLRRRNQASSSCGRQRRLCDLGPYGGRELRAYVDSIELTHAIPVAA